MPAADRSTDLSTAATFSRTVSAAEAGTTVSAFVRALLPGTSWSRARELCQSGRVWIDGAAARDPASRLAAASAVEVRPEGARAPRGPLAPEDIVHADAEVVVVHKPAGLLTVPWSDEDRDTLVTLARTVLTRRESGRGGARAESGGSGPHLRVVQRLDKETSGLLVFARTVAAERHLQQQLRAHSMGRRYLALVHGRAADATYETLLVPDRGDGLRGSWGVFRRPKGTPPETARRAVTHVEVRERLHGATYVACELATGRQHQIRIHLSEAGFPLVGERVYVRGFAGALLPAPRPMLHAARLAFIHPRSGREMVFEAPPPADFVATLARLRA
jgi:23S rRNA pseudouridine1911/1915/1917 synthase